MKVFHLVHLEARKRALQYIAEAPEGWRVTVAPAKRTADQNAKFHAMCEDIARQVKWQGKFRSKEQWKVLLVSGHAVATKEETENVPGLEGEYVNLRESTASMTKARGSSLIEYTAAWAAMNGVVFRDEASLSSTV